MKVSKDLVVSLYRSMVRIRLFELKVREVYRSGVMPGFIHLYISEEAVAAGICANLNADDYVTSTHRGHGHAVAKGIRWDRFLPKSGANRTDAMGVVGAACTFMS